MKCFDHILSHRQWKAILLSIGVSGEESFDAKTLWDRYSQALGTRLKGTVHDPLTLERMVKHGAQVADVSSGAIFAGCSNYFNGSIIAKLSRSSAESACVGLVTRPLKVDSENDQMCFALFSSAGSSISKEMQSFFSFTVALAEPVKIHSKIYEYLQSPESDKMYPDLVVSFIANQTLVGKQNVNTAEAIQTILMSLTSYPTEIFDNFFWTSSDTAKHFEASDVSAKDSETFSIWRSLAQYMNEILKGDSPESKYLKVYDDPCKFKTLNVIKHPSQLVISLDNIKQLGQPLQASCLAYMTAALAQRQESWHVAFAERPKHTNFRVRSITQSATIGSDLYFAPYTAAGLRGDGQVAGITDTGLDMQSCYFIDTHKANVPDYSSVSSPVTNLNSRKVVQYTFNPGGGDTNDETAGHGTHVSGTVAGSRLGGDITQNGVYNGVAPNAKIAFMDCATTGGGLSIPSIPTLYEPARSAGARVHTNSWGSIHTSADYYTTTDTDQYLYDNMDMTIFFANGNFGGDGLYSTNIEAQAKNVISVGSSETTWQSSNINYVSFFSSLGPSYDGRIKPDIVAPGEQIQSARSNGGNGQSCQVVSMMGTSMASPSAAGVALLIRQYFQETNVNIWTSMCNRAYSLCNSFTPSGVLVKAVMLHSGSPMQSYWSSSGLTAVSPSTPNFMNGFGRINLLNVLPLKGYTSFDLFIDDLRSIGENSQIGYNVVVTDSSVPLKVTVSWYDPPAVPGTTGSALIHDLDLTIVDPSGATFYGNGGTSSDTINNNEQVLIPSPQSGTYQVTISSKSLPVAGSQPFSLVITSGGYVQ